MTFNLKNTGILPCERSSSGVHEWVSGNSGDYCANCISSKEELTEKAKCAKSPTGFHLLNRNWLSAEPYGNLSANCSYCDKKFRVDSVGYDTSGMG